MNTTDNEHHRRGGGARGMKLIIAGGRDYRMDLADYYRLEEIHLHFGPITEIVSGGATGADSEGELWAKLSDIPVKKFEADWRTHGNAAGPIRNRQMAEYADAVALFRGGKGTASMEREAKRAGIAIYDFRKAARSSLLLK